jgi:hypothetical protein
MGMRGKRRPGGAARRAALRVGLTATAAGGAMLGSAGGAAAEIIPDDLGVGAVQGVSDVLGGTLGTTADATAHALGPVADLQLNPLANTGTDPLSNSAGTQIADFRPVSTDIVTGPLADGASLRTLPGEVLGRLTGPAPATP